jgi:RND family efflux transporter MFP subunit
MRRALSLVGRFVMKRFSWLLLSLTPALGFSTAGCQEAAAAKPKPPTPVRVVEVGAPAAKDSAKYSGAVDPVVSVELAFRANGYVKWIAEVHGEKRILEEGDWVEKGTVLARIKADDYAEHAATAAAATEEAAASKKLAEKEYERAERLAKKGAITPAELDVRSARLDAAKAQVAGARARAGEASVALSDTVLKAPISGVILKRRVEIGTLVTPGMPAFLIADTRAVTISFGAPERLAAKLEVGSPLEIESESIGFVPGTVTRISPSADRAGRMFSVESTVDSRGGKIKPGTIVSVRISEGDHHADEVVLPLTSIVRSPHDPSAFAVFVVKQHEGGSAAELREIDAGVFVGNSVVIDKGIAKGERAVIMGAPLLRDGELVSIIP